MKKGEDVMVGTSQPSIIKALSQSPKLLELANTAEQVIKGVIHESAGVSELKPTNIKLYSTTTCPYCKMEATWLVDKKIKFDEVHVDLDEKEADDMVKKTGQMGVPVTSILYEGGEEEFIVGFDKEKLSSILNIKN
jgi:glutaredoxin